MIKIISIDRELNIVQNYIYIIIIIIAFETYNKKITKKGGKTCRKTVKKLT